MTARPSLLADFLASPRVPAGSLSMAALDGYLTALHAGPTVILPSEWMAGIWGDDPVFDDQAEAQSILNALMTHYNAIGAALDGSREAYRPYGWPDNRTERPSTELAAEWALGFWQGMQLNSLDWRTMIRDKEARVLLAPIACFLKTADGESVLYSDPEERDERMIDAIEMIPQVVPAIRDYWRSNASRTTRSRAAKPGRNDPCPCGSGQKYKRCCGAD